MPAEVTATREDYAERDTSPLTGALAQAADWTQREMAHPWADSTGHNVLLTIGDGVMLAWPAPPAGE